MTDLDRVLDSLLHDLRSPLGVAGGYLRLLKEGRLSSAEDTERAIVKAQEALRTMTTLCADASEWLAVDTAGEPATLPVATFAAEIRSEGVRSGVTIEAIGTLDGTLTLQLDSTRVARAVTSLLAVVTRSASGQCTARRDGGVLRVSALVEQRQGPGGGGSFDPWEFPGLGPALACRVIVRAGGRCLRGPEAAAVVHVEFDLDADDMEGRPR